MTRYSVIITDPNRNHGVGPVGLTAIIVREAD